MDLEQILKLCSNFGLAPVLLILVLWRLDRHVSRFLNHFSHFHEDMKKIAVLIDLIATKLGVSK